MLPIYKYHNFYSLVNDLENGKDIFCKFGKISSVTLNNVPKTKTGYIEIWIESYNRVYRESTRFAFTYNEFKNILFTKLAYGLYYYIYVKNLGTYWDYAALPDLQQEAYNSYGYELYLKELKVFFPASIPLSPKVNNLIIVPEDSKLLISWDSIPGATSYILYWTNIPEVTIYSNRVEKIESNSFVLEGLTNNNLYYVRVAVMEPNYPTNNPMSDENFGIPQPLPEIPVLIITNDGNKNILSWTPIETSDFFNITGDHYQIFWNDTDTPVSETDSMIDLIKANIFVHESLTSGVTYRYKVRKVNLRGMSDLSNEVSFTIP